MTFIPFKALKFGGESLYPYQVSYGKSRLSGSNQVTYILHCKGGCMPGQRNIFTTTSCSKPGIGTSVEFNKVISEFKRDNPEINSKVLGGSYPNYYQDDFTYKKFAPVNDESLKVAIKASYIQVYGNLNPMEIERPIDLERRLRNGDIPIREFIRGLALSPFYRFHFFEKVNQQRCIELSFKHLLGRPPINQNEIIKSVELMANYGFNAQIDSLIDSMEYANIFGEDTVPYNRCWNSPIGLSTSSFNNAATLSKSFASSDNSVEGRYTYPDSPSGKSQLLNTLASRVEKNIQFPCHTKLLL